MRDIVSSELETGQVVRIAGMRALVGPINHFHTFGRFGRRSPETVYRSTCRVLDSTGEGIADVFGSDIGTVVVQGNDLRTWTIEDVECRVCGGPRPCPLDDIDTTVRAFGDAFRASSRTYRNEPDPWLRVLCPPV